MTSTLLLENFEELADAPNGVPKLRELILQLAVRGKLVPQDPNDEPASELLRRIQVERQRLIAEGKARNAKPLPPPEPKEKPFEIPASWQWDRFTNTCYVISPGDRKVKTKAVGSAGVFPVVDQGQSHIAGYVSDESLVTVIPGPVIVFGDHTRAVKYVDFDFVAGADGTKILRPLLLHEWYFCWALKSLTLEDRGYSRHFKVLKKQLIPIPPLPEQKRIVAKVDELMSLCDDLEARQQATRTKQIALNSAYLHALTEPNGASLSAAWHRIRDQFDDLYAVPETVADLRQTILQLAVMGRLVPQDPNDEPASELLKKIQVEKQRLIDEGQMKKAKPLPPIEDDEIPHQLPQGWKWIQLGSIAIKVTDGEHQTPRRSETGFYLLSARNVTNEGIALEDVDYVPEDEFQRIRKRCDPDQGDLLISCSGSIGRVAIVDRSACYAMVRSAAMVRFDQEHWDSEFGAYMLRAPNAQSQMQEKARQMAQANLFLGKIRSLVVPVPPLAEQKRIVTKVDQLMTLCDNLETKLQRSQTDVDNLLTAIVHQLVEPVEVSAG